MCSVHVFARFMDYYIRFGATQRVQPWALIPKSIQVHWKVSLASTNGSTAYWHKARVREWSIRQHLFATQIPWFSHNLSLLVSTFHNRYCWKWQNQEDTFIDLLFCSGSIVSLDVLDSPSPCFSSDCLLLLHFLSFPLQLIHWDLKDLMYSKECSDPFFCSDSMNAAVSLLSIDL